MSLTASGLHVARDRSPVVGFRRTARSFPAGMLAAVIPPEPHRLFGRETFVHPGYRHRGLELRLTVPTSSYAPRDERWSARRRPDRRLPADDRRRWSLGRPTVADGATLYVPDADPVYQVALEAGAASICAPVDQPYGDREGSVKDVAGNHWYIATHQTGGHVPEGLGTVTPFLHPRGASQLIEFMKRAFGAEEIAIHCGPEGAIGHAVVRLGSSAIEMSEAHGEWSPMPTMFYAYVDDVDVSYRRALDAGATSLKAPGLQPCVERRAAVRDPFENQWYLAARGLDGRGHARLE